MADVTEDYLTEDPEISSQKIVLLSFLSPEKILADKDVFMFNKFVKDYDLQWRTKKLEVWMAEQLSVLNAKLETLAGKLADVDKSASETVQGSLLRVDRFVEEFQQHLRKSTRDATDSAIQAEYDDFLFKNSAKLEEEFFAKNEFRTTIRGIKVRGVFATEAEASVRAKRLQKSDPNFNIYMGGVGKWMAWEPDPNKVVEQEYANDQLNNLMKKYRDNENDREQFYNDQKNSRVGTAKTRDLDTVSAVSEAAAGAAAAAGATAEPTVTVTPSVAGSSSSPVAADVSAPTEPEDVSTAAAPPSASASDVPAPLTSSGAGPAAVGSYDAMFSGPADLAIERKMKNKM